MTAGSHGDQQELKGKPPHRKKIEEKKLTTSNCLRKINPR
jgi:hypothetical protein